MCECAQEARRVEVLRILQEASRGSVASRSFRMRKERCQEEVVGPPAPVSTSTPFWRFAKLTLAPVKYRVKKLAALG